MTRNNLSYHHILLTSDFKWTQALEQVEQDQQWQDDASGVRWRR